jgi:hypothetical protein
MNEPKKNEKKTCHMINMILEYDRSDQFERFGIENTTKVVRMNVGG